MTRTWHACVALALLAGLLAGLLLFSVRGRFAPPVSTASAAMVAGGSGQLVLMTTRVVAGDERLFVIDNTRHALLVYDIDQHQRQLEPQLVQDLDRLFGAIANEPAGPPPPRVPR